MLVQPAHTVTAHDAFLPHGFCYLWDRQLLWTHFWSDLLIGLSYVTISFSLAWLVHKARRDIPFSVAFVAFGLFIVTCGLTHFMGIWTLWEPVYWLEGGVKVVTAAASVATAAAMPFWAPRAHATIRDARLSRERELTAARAAALEEQNARLQQLTATLEQRNEALHRIAHEAEESRRSAEDARRVADEANRTKSEFLAVMSHELRTPLNAIGGYVDLQTLGVRGTLTAEQQQDLDRIRRSQRHLLGLIDDVLSYSRIHAERVSYEIGDVSLADVLADVAAMIEPLAAAARLTCTFEPCPAGLLAVGDREKVRQILLNLLSNAVKYTPEGGRITVSCGTDGGRTFVRVADTGIGIPPEKHDEVFEPFVQLDRSLTRRYGGTGLGLAISRQLADGMDGELALASAAGAGAVFTLWLPRRLAQAA